MKSNREDTEKSHPKQTSIWGDVPGGVILVLLLMGLLMTGCAHRARPDVSSNNEAPVVATQPASSLGTDTADTNETATDETDEFDDSFTEDFEEPFEEKEITIADPLEPLNRMFLVINDKLYFWVLKPAARVFKAVVPEGIRVSTGNALKNVKAPIRITNSLLQGKFKQAGTEFGRFFINTTVGILGLGDPAAMYPFFDHDREDMGQTLAVWGIKDGIYLVLPFFGPSTLRDAVGKVGDHFLDPLTYGLEGSESLYVTAYGTVNGLSFRLGQYEAVKEGSLDPYVFMKNAYLQIRQDKISK
jgi:phospholipid-binding lipoprotein MlaA